MGKTPALIEGVPPGFYEVVLRHEGYEDVFERVFVTAGETYSISKKLQVSRWVYSISSSPSGASVYLDGKYKGVSPVVFHADEGQHKLTIKKTGYSPVSKEINASGEPSIVVEEKLHLSPITYFVATLVLLAAGIYIKKNPEKLKLKFPKKVPADEKVLEKVRMVPGKRDETTEEIAVEEDKKPVPENEKLKGELNEKLQGKLSVSDGLVELENISEPDFIYTVKKKK